MNNIKKAYLLNNNINEYGIMYLIKNESANIIKIGVTNNIKKRIRILLEHFGSIENIKNASVDELEKVKGISRKLAIVISEFYSKKEFTFS